MFFNFDYSHYLSTSIIYVDLIGDLSKEKDFKLFTDNWLSLYSLKTEFIFVFRTNKIQTIHPIFCIKMAMFIYTLKQQPIHYLKKSIFIIQNEYIRKLLYYIFYLQSPVSDIYIIETEDMLTPVLKNEIHDNVIHITP
jgi:hypothetical protein